MIIQLALIYWIFISFLAIKINLNTFKKLHGYQQSKINKPQWQGLIRTDFQQWNKTKIIIGSFTILPLRFFALGNFVAGALMFALVICWLNEGSLKQKVIKAFNWYLNNYGRLMNNLAMKIEDNCPNPSDRIIKTPIIISNHSCWFDIFYLTLKYSPVSFVAKHQIQFWPVIGPCAKAMSCIFVKRQSQNDRNQVRALIKQRIDEFYENKKGAFPLIIFPEGTTSNNRVVLNFKSGAFQNLSPLTIFCIKYQCDNCQLAEDQIQQSEHIFLMLSQRNKMIVEKVEVEPLPEEKDEQYKERCRKILSEKLGFKRVNVGYRDRIDLEKYRKTGVTK